MNNTIFYLYFLFLLKTIYLYFFIIDFIDLFNIKYFLLFFIKLNYVLNVVTYSRRLSWDSLVEPLNCYQSTQTRVEISRRVTI